jgi:hypothetical protein
MKRTLTILVAFVVMAGNYSNAQQKEEKKFGIQLSGFVKNDFFFDSRQTVTAREGHFLLWPSAESLDANEDDINAKSNFNMLAIQSRLTGKISGPDAFGAKTSGVIEGDFFAQANDNINLFRLRHAFIKLKWTNTELLTGQYWNPLFVTGCFPGTVSFNTGTPLQSFARNPQIRVTQSLGDIKVIGALLGQRDYTSRGPDGVTSSYLRNSGTPDMHFQIHYDAKNIGEGTDLLLGAGIAYKTIAPRIKSTVEVSPEVETYVVNPDNSVTKTVIPAVTNSYSVDESVSGLTAIGFAKLKTNQITLKLQGRYGENIADVLSISGFAVKDVVNPTTGKQSYTPLKNMTIWGDLHTNGKKFQVGVFGGYTKNLGTKEAMSSTGNAVYGLGTNIESLLRISPRAIINSGKFRVALELEYTEASFGEDFDLDYKPASTTTTSNLRTLLSTYYFF